MDASPGHLCCKDTLDSNWRAVQPCTTVISDLHYICCCRTMSNKIICTHNVLCKIREQDQKHDKLCMLPCWMFCSASLTLWGQRGNQKEILTKQVACGYYTLPACVFQYTAGLYTGSALWITLQLTRLAVEPGSKIYSLYMPYPLVSNWLYLSGY